MSRKEGGKCSGKRDLLRREEKEKTERKARCGKTNPSIATSDRCITGPSRRGKRKFAKRSPRRKADVGGTQNNAFDIDRNS